MNAHFTGFRTARLTVTVTRWVPKLGWLSFPKVLVHHPAGFVCFRQISSDATGFFHCFVVKNKHRCIVKSERGIFFCVRQSSPVEDPPEPPEKGKKTKSGGFSFTLRVALRHRPSRQQGTDEVGESEGGAEAEVEKKRVGRSSQAKEMKRVKFELEETAVSRPSPPEERGSDSAEDVPESFLAKRAQNIKANKAMVSCKCSVRF